MVRLRSTPPAAAALLAVAAAWLAGHGLDTGILFLAPALLLALPLLHGRYVGEELVVRLAERRRPRPRAARRATAPAARPPAALLPRGGSIVASWLARRPPPVACA